MRKTDEKLTLFLSINFIHKKSMQIETKNFTTLNNKNIFNFLAPLSFLYTFNKANSTTKKTIK